jgi:hypothetical protein
MRLRSRIYNLSKKFSDRLVDRTSAFAFPGHGVQLPPVLLIALPKSGSVYLQRALRRTLQVEVRHIGSAGMTGSNFRYADLCRFARGNVVSREHLQPRGYLVEVLAAYGVKKLVLHIRDPRAAIVSWTRHMDRLLADRGLQLVELSCELLVPNAYVDWAFPERLRWQVENKLPTFVSWIEDWLQLVRDTRDVEFLVTDYQALCDDARGLLMQMLDFYGINYDPDWITMPAVRVGKNNIYTMPDAKAQTGSQAGEVPAWVNAMPADVLQAANAMMPASLVERFGWPKS